MNKRVNGPCNHGVRPDVRYLFGDFTHQIGKGSLRTEWFGYLRYIPTDPMIVIILASRSILLAGKKSAVAVWGMGNASLQIASRAERG